MFTLRNLVLSHFRNQVLNLIRYELFTSTDISIEGLNLICNKYPALTFYNAKDVMIEELELSDITPSGISVNGVDSKNIRIDGKSIN